MPSTRTTVKDVVETVADARSLAIFSSALESAGLAGTLRGAGPFTVLAPADGAFARLAEHALDEWLRPDGRTKLRGILAYHVVPGHFPAAEIIKSSTVKTLQGTGLTIRYKDNRLYVNNATVLVADVECGNGVIHVLDTVMIPR